MRAIRRGLRSTYRGHEATKVPKQPKTTQKFPKQLQKAMKVLKQLKYDNKNSKTAKNSNESARERNPQHPKKKWVMDLNIHVFGVQKSVWRPSKTCMLHVPCTSTHFLKL